MCCLCVCVCRGNDGNCVVMAELLCRGDTAVVVHGGGDGVVMVRGNTAASWCMAVLW